MKNIERLATFVRNKKTRSYIVVNSTDLSILNDFKYANYINDSMIKDYTIKANEELKLIQKRYKKILTSNKNIIDKVLDTDRYIKDIKKEGKVFEIDPPLYPNKSNQNLLEYLLYLYIRTCSGMFLRTNQKRIS